MHWAAPFVILLAATQTSERAFHEIDQDIRAAMRREAAADTLPKRYAAVEELADLYHEILEHSRFATSPTLQKYRVRIWSRLTRTKRELERRLSREDSADPSLVSSDMATSVGAHLAFSASTLGGPARLLSTVPPDARGGAAIQDHGQALVTLIQRTIDPSFWDVNGGPGTIVYYAPLRVLVVRATSEMHHSVGQNLNALRQ